MAAGPEPCHDLKHWNVLARRTFGEIEVQARPGRFSAAMATREVASLRLVDVVSTPARVHGGPTRHAGWYLLFNRGGACTLRQRGRSTPLDDGELSLLRSDEPFDIAFDQPNRMCVLGLSALDAPWPMDDRVARRHTRDDAVVVGTLLQHLQQLRPDAADRMDPAALRRALFDLLRLMPHQGDGGASPLPPTRRRLLLARLHALVESRLDDPELDAEALGRTLGISARHVQALFAGQGTTLGACLLEQRLQWVARRLREPGRPRERIGAIAMQAGFGDLSHFCRSFRRRFRCSASAWREMA